MIGNDFVNQEKVTWVRPLNSEALAEGGSMESVKMLLLVWVYVLGDNHYKHRMKR